MPPSARAGGARPGPPPLYRVFGVNPVAAALAAGRVRKLYAAISAHGARITEIVAEAEAMGVKVKRVSGADLDELSSGERHQGIVAEAKTPEPLELDDLIASAGTDPIVVLDGIEDPRNFGAVIRVAAASGAAGVVARERRAAPLSPLVAKAAAGATELTALARVTNIPEALKRLKQAGYWVVGATGDAEKDLFSFEFPEKFALVLGAEGKGLSRLVVESCDFTVAIPLLRGVESLNVATAAAVLLYERLRRSHP